MVRGEEGTGKVGEQKGEVSVQFFSEKIGGFGS